MLVSLLRGFHPARRRGRCEGAEILRSKTRSLAMEISSTTPFGVNTESSFSLSSTIFARSSIFPIQIHGGSSQLLGLLLIDFEEILSLQSSELSETSAK